jgi:predicted HicB family RNase H-like nuclease
MPVEEREKDEKDGKKRMIHIRLQEDVHKRLRIRVAELDTTIQEWVEKLITRVLERVG